MDYDKQPINVDEQVALLQNRGLVIEDIATAKLQLRNISYFRIASYLRYMEEDRQFLGSEVTVFFLRIHRLPNGNPCFSLQIHAKKITRTN